MFTLTSFAHNNEIYHLRLLTHDYAEPLASIVRKDFLYLSQFLPRPKADMSTEDEISFITMKLAEFSRQESCACVICDDENNPLGLVDVHEYSKTHRRGEIGYRLASDYQGKGIMTQAVIHFAEIIHTMRQCNKLSLLAQHNNTGSNRVAINAGFVFVCTFKQHIMQNGILEDMNVYEKYWEDKANL